MKLRYLVALAAAGALVFGACGSGDDDDDDTGGNGGADATATTTGDATQTSSGGSATAAPGKTAEATKPAATAETADSLFDRLAADAITKTYQAKYDLEIDMNGVEQKGTATMASKPPKYASVMEFSLGGAKFAFTIINDGTTPYFCSDFGAGGSCSKDEEFGGAQGVDVKKAIDEARKGKDVKEIDKRTIAGRSGRCFEATDPETNTKSTFCLDEKDSILLFFQVEGVKMTATEVKTSVDDKLFELPYPVK
jgi:hypothetical protein